MSATQTDDAGVVVTDAGDVTAAPRAAIGTGSGMVVLRGELVSWSMHGRTTISEVRGALIAAGWTPAEAAKLAPDMRPHNAFRRVRERLERSTKRLIRQVDHSDTFWAYQLNSVSKAADRAAPETAAADDATVLKEVQGIEFPLEGYFYFGKKSGRFTAGKPKDEPTAATLNAAIDAEIDLRTATDVTHIVQRLFVDRAKTVLDADLFSVRDSGGVYLALSSQMDFVTRVEQFVTTLKGKFPRYRIAAGDEKSEASIRETIEGGLAGLVVEYRQAIDSLHDATRQGRIDEVAARITMLREKLACYEAFLGVTLESVRDDLSSANDYLRSKLVDIASRPPTPDATPAASPLVA
jgi:hypothetical protein